MADASSNVVRPPATAAAGNASSSTATTTENKAVAARRHVAELLERVDCEMYASHASASSETTQACLTAIHQLLLHLYHRGFTNVASLWESSLRVLEQASGATAINYFDTSAALLLCGKFTKAREVAWRCIQCNSNTTPAPMLTSFAYFCRVVSVYLIASEALQLLPHEELVAEIRTMTNARRTNKEKNETATADDEASTQLLLAAVEWLGSSNVEPTSALCLREGSEELWRGRQASLMDAAKAAHRRCSPISSHDRQRRPPSPFHLLRRGVQATKHAKALVDIYEEAVEMERSHPDFTLFELPRRMGERLLQHHHHAVFSSSLARSNPSCTRASVIARLGSSLSPTLIAHHGQTRQGYRQAIHILGQMHGPEAYGAMKQVLMHRSPTECRRIQGIYGDVLRATHDGWESALQNLHEEVAVASGTWRAQLPETLRLLSDAGKHEDFLRLIAEYNVMEGGANLSVAASLAQVARQQGTWWRAMEVVDLIAHAKRRPHTMTEDHLFLTDACVQTTYALRDAHKWKEALAFYSMLQPAFPPHAVRVLHAVVAGMPTSSPWEAALACISSSGGTPPAGSIISSLAFARGVADLPTSPRDQQHALQVASHAGAWEVLLPHALSEGLDQNEVVDRWTLVMQGWARGEDGDASASIFASLPSTLVQHAGFITRAYTAARIHGRLAELVSYINRSGGRGVAAEVAALAELVLHGVRAESVQREWTSAFVLREWCTFITASPMRVWLGPPSASAEEQRRLEERVAPPAGWLGHSRAGRPFLHLRGQPLPPKLMLHVEDDLAAFVVVAGGSFFGACCGAAAHCSQQHYALYRPIYHLPRGVGGIALLVPASLSTSTWSTSLRVRCVVVPAFTDAPPLLSCNFFSTYGMVLEKTIRDDDVDEGDDEDGSLRVLVTCTEVGTHTLAQLLRDVEAEGWRVDISEGRSAVVEFVRAVRSQQDRHVLVEIPPARV